MPDDDRDRYCCSGCPALGGPSGIGGSFYCESGYDQVDLETHDGRPLRSAQCVAANQPLLTREEFLAAVRELADYKNAPVVKLPEITDIKGILWYFDGAAQRMYIRLRDDIASVPILQPREYGQYFVFVCHASWGQDAVAKVNVALSGRCSDREFLQHLLAGLGETEPAQTD
jgi:hypothetical protein